MSNICPINSLRLSLTICSSFKNCQVCPLSKIDSSKGCYNFWSSDSDDVWWGIVNIIFDQFRKKDKMKRFINSLYGVKAYSKFTDQEEKDIQIADEVEIIIDQSDGFRR